MHRWTATQLRSCPELVEVACPERVEVGVLLSVSTARRTIAGSGRLEFSSVCGQPSSRGAAPQVR